MGDGDDDDDTGWLVRTELEPRPMKSNAPQPLPQAPPSRRPPSMPVELDSSPNVEVSGTFWLVATAADLRSLVSRKMVDTRNPFTGQMGTAEYLVLDPDALGRLPHVRQRPTEDCSSAEAAAALLEGAGCDLVAPTMKSAGGQMRVYELPEAAVSKLTAAPSNEVAALAQTALARGGKLWAFLDDDADDD